MLTRLLKVMLIFLGYVLQFNLPWEVRMRKVLENLGGAFVKLGQILALRSDVIPEKLAVEFLHLLDRMPPISQSQVSQIIRSELGQEAEDLFIQFEWQPLATASFAQVHRATLKNGEEVIVKVQKSGLYNLVKIDLKILEFLAHLADFFGLLGAMKVKIIFRQFSQWTLNELDYQHEAKLAESLARQAQSLNIRVPKIYWAFTTQKILVEEYLEGITIREILEQPVLSEAESQLIAFELIKNAMNQYFLYGQFHADPHAGNILFLKNSNLLGYVDFGIVGQSQLSHRIAMAHFVNSAFSQQYDMAISAFFHLGLVERFQKDLPYLLADEEFITLLAKHLPIFKKIVAEKFSKIMMRWQKAIVNSKASFAQKSAAGAFLKFLGLAREYKIVLNSEIILFIKTLIAVDALSLKLNSQFNLIQTVNAVFNLPPYVEIFSKQALNELHQPLENIRPIAKKNDERAERLKNYYLEWFYEILSRHKAAFKL